METLLKSIDLSRLSVTALDNNNNNIEKTNIAFKDSNLFICIYTLYFSRRRDSNSHS
jgi:hypothetical protein